MNPITGTFVLQQTTSHFHYVPSFPEYLMLSFTFAVPLCLLAIMLYREYSPSGKQRKLNELEINSRSELK